MKDAQNVTFDEDSMGLMGFGIQHKSDESDEMALIIHLKLFRRA